MYPSIFVKEVYQCAGMGTHRVSACLQAGPWGGFTMDLIWPPPPGSQGEVAVLVAAPEVCRQVDSTPSHFCKLSAHQPHHRVVQGRQHSPGHGPPGGDIIPGSQEFAKANILNGEQLAIHSNHPPKPLSQHLVRLTPHPSSQRGCHK